MGGSHSGWFAPGEQVKAWGLEAKLCPEPFACSSHGWEGAVGLALWISQPRLAPHPVLPPAQFQPHWLLSSSDVPGASAAFQPLHMLLPQPGNLFPHSLPEKLLRL